MKVSLNWVKEFTDVGLPIDELVAKIGAQLGAVEEVIDLGKKYQGIVIAKVVSCEKHPNADKLKVCLIDDGKKTKDVQRNKDGLVEVVCGAPNVKEGMLVAWLPPGTTVPSTYDNDPFKLEAREIRGVISNGMLASAHELALSDEHSGIIELSFGEIGGDFAKEFGLNDHIIDIENKMFTHRPDLFGILGIAREIAGITGQKFRSPDWYATARSNRKEVRGNKLPLEVVNSVAERVPRFMAASIENVDVRPSPVWMQAYLSRVGIRPINNIVDVTNYAMYLTAQPLHAYDYDKLIKIAETKHAVLEARMSKKGDKLKLLNGKDLEFEDNQTVLITSGDVPVGIGGVMGGADTEVDETTKNIVLECANFDMYSIRRTAMQYGLFTDAVTRFNKGQSSSQNRSVLQKATEWTVQLAGGEPGKAADVYPKPVRPIAVHVTEEFINARLGPKLGIKEMARLLENVEFDVAINGPTLAVTPPFWRTDIEIPEDVVEEIGRLYGYDNLPLELPKRSLMPQATNGLLKLKGAARDILVAAGANEVLNYSFVHGNLFDRVGQDRTQAFQLSNALSPDLQYYRLSLTPSLLEKVHPNIKAGHSEFAMFEIGKTHTKSNMENGLPKEFERLALVFSADKKSQIKYAGAAYYQAKEYLLSLCRQLGLDKQIAFEPIRQQPRNNETAYYEAARSATIKLGNNTLGYIGEYKSSVAQMLKLPEFTAGFELEFETLAGSVNNTGNYVALPKFPKVEQDISMKVSAKVTYSELFDCVQSEIDKQKPNHTIAVLAPLDIYQKEKSHKQITLRLSIASYERTMVDQEVNELLNKTAEAAYKKLGAQRI